MPGKRPSSLGSRPCGPRRPRYVTGRGGGDRRGKARMSDEKRIARMARALHINLPFVRSIPAEAQWIVGLTLLAWTFKAVVLDAIPEFCPRASALGGVVDGLFSAIIAGYVFYVLFALWPEYNGRKLLARFVSTKVRGIVGDCCGIMDEINRQAKGFIDPNCTDNDYMLSVLKSVK